MPDISPAVWSLVGTVVGGFIGYFSTKRLAIFRTKIEAKIKLRSAFAPVIAKYPLQKGSTMNDIDKMFREELTSQAIAIEEFRPFVTTNRKEEYQKAWENYHKPKGAGSSIFFLEYTDEKLFKERIHAILQFTDV